jgi:hypothetical protein
MNHPILIISFFHMKTGISELLSQKQQWGITLKQQLVPHPCLLRIVTAMGEENDVQR